MEVGGIPSWSGLYFDRDDLHLVSWVKTAESYPSDYLHVSHYGRATSQVLFLLDVITQ